MEKGDLRGLISKLDYIKSLGVDCIWIFSHLSFTSKTMDTTLPIFTVFIPIMEPLTDFKALVKEAHQRLKIIADLVLNQHF